MAAGGRVMWAGPAPPRPLSGVLVPPVGSPGVRAPCSPLCSQVPALASLLKVSCDSAPREFQVWLLLHKVRGAA